MPISPHLRTQAIQAGKDGNDMIVNDTILWSGRELLFLDKRLHITYDGSTLAVMDKYTKVEPTQLKNEIIRQVLGIKTDWEVPQNKNGSYCGYMLGRWYPGSVRMSKHMTGSYLTRHEAHRWMRRYALRLQKRVKSIVNYHIEASNFNTQKSKTHFQRYGGTT